MTSPLSGTPGMYSLLYGWDTQSLVSQWMQGAPVQMTDPYLSTLRSELTADESAASAYRAVNSAFAALQSAATALTQPSTWSAVQATSSSPTVTASVSAGAPTGSVSFSVDQLAAAHSVITAQNWTSTSDAFGLGSSMTLTSANGTATTITVGGSGTLADAISAINGANAGVTATAVNTGSGYRLQVTANATGAANAFTLTASGGTASTFSVLTQGQDAQITVGSGTSAYQVTSSTDTFSGVLAGTTFTVGQAGTSATVTVAPDAASITAAVQSLVDTANNALSTISQYTDPTAGSAVPLPGDQTVAGLATQVLDAVTSSPGGNSAALAGIQVTADGRLSFDSTTFQSELAANPSLVQSILGGTVGAGADGVTGTADDSVATDGLGARLAVLAAQASDPATGLLTALAQGEDSTVSDLQSQIAAWDAPLQQSQQSLTQRITAMDSLLGLVNGQSSWLSAALSVQSLFPAG